MNRRVAKHAVAVLACGIGLIACGGGDRTQIVERGSSERMVIAGSGVPADAQGRDGDFYLDAQTRQLYGPRTHGVWPLPPVPLTGPVGASGQDGQDGEDGASVLNGNGLPLNTLGREGDFYIDLTTTTLYGPKSAGAWPGSGIALSGVAGPVGPAGPTGPAGSGTFALQWNIPSSVGIGNGTVYLNPQGINAAVRYPVLLPQACTQARLQVSTFGAPTAGNRFSFQALRTPGPDIDASRTADVAGLSCTITDTVRSCDVSASVSLQDGDAIEVLVEGTQAINETGGSWSIGFTCE